MSISGPGCPACDYLGYLTHEGSRLAAYPCGACSPWSHGDDFPDAALRAKASRIRKVGDPDPRMTEWALRLLEYAEEVDAEEEEAMSGVVTRLREMAALSEHPVDVYALCGEAAREIENLRILYAHACDSSRREAERAERAESRVDGFLDRIAMANAEAHRSTAELAAIGVLIEGGGSAEEILVELRVRLNTRTAGDVEGA